MLTPTLFTSRAFGDALPLSLVLGALRLRPGEAGSAAPAGTGTLRRNSMDI